MSVKKQISGFEMGGNSNKFREEELQTSKSL